MADIYDEFGKDLYRITDGPVSTYMIDPERIDAGLLSGTQTSMIGGGKTQFLNTSVSGRSITLSPGQSIQQALDQLNEVGGGTLYLEPGTYNLKGDVSLYANINFIGSGRDITILDFGSLAAGVKMIGTSSAIMKNNSIKDLTIQNSNNAAGLDIDYADFWVTENVKVSSCDQDGIRIMRSVSFRIENVFSSSNTGDGFYFEGATARDMTKFLLSNCFSQSNGGNGYYFWGSNTGVEIYYFNIINCNATSNTGDGFDFTNSGANADILDFTMMGCTANANTIGFDFNGPSQAMILGCIDENNSSWGFDVASGSFYVFLIGNSAEGGGYNVDGQGAVLIGNRGDSNSSTPGWTTPDNRMNAYGNPYGFFVDNADVSSVKNTSGGIISTGGVAVWKGAAGELEMTTTTTGGDSKVAGVLQFGASNNAYGYLLVQGKTSVLKVDGTTDIAIGDYLCTFTTAGIAQKATTTGQVVFAVALEAYTTDDSNGVIDAYVLPWRLTLP